MAKLLPETRLKIPTPKGLITGIEVYNADLENVLITHDHKYVMIYNAADQKIVKDWTVQGQNLVSPAVCYGSPLQFSAVCRKSVIRTWSSGDINIEKSKKTSAITEVHELWVPYGRDTPYIVHSDGSCASLDDKETLVTPQQIHSDGKILWSGRTTGLNPVLVLVVKDQNEHFTVLYHWDKDTDSVSSSKALLPLAEGEVKDFAVCGDYSSKVYLFTLSHNRKLSNVIEKMCVYDKKKIQEGHKEISLVADISNCTGLCVLDEDQIVVAGKNVALKKCGLSIWDLKYGFARQFCCVDAQQKNSKIFKVNDIIFMSTMADNHVALHVVQANTTLASAFGQLHDKINVASGNHAKKKDVLENARSCLKKLADSQKSTSKETFESEMKRFFELESSLDENRMLILATELELVIKRLAQENFCVEPDIIDRLLLCKSLQGDVASSMIPMLQKYGSVEMIHKALRSLTDIPEASLVQALSCYLETFKVIARDEINNMEGETRSLYCQEDSSKLNHLLRLPYNDVFLIECLGDMDFDNVLRLLKYLVSLLVGISDAPDASKDEEMPLLEQVVSWMNVVLDAHFAQIVLSADCREVLLDLQRTVDEQVQFYEELVGLESLLYQLRQNVILPTKQSVGQYCIQTLHVR